MKGIHSMNEMKVLLKEVDTEGKNCLWHITKNKVYSILDHKLIERLVMDYWESNIDTTAFIFEASTCFRILTYDNLDYINDFEETSRFYFPFK